MYKTIILPLAKADIKEAALWYNKQQPGLGKRFTKEVRTKVADIKNNPLAYSVRYDDVRTAIVDVFPFMVHFISLMVRVFSLQQHSTLESNIKP